MPFVLPGSFVSQCLFDCRPWWTGSDCRHTAAPAARISYRKALLIAGAVLVPAAVIDHTVSIFVSDLQSLPASDVMSHTGPLLWNCRIHWQGSRCSISSGEFERSSEQRLRFCRCCHDRSCCYQGKLSHSVVQSQHSVVLPLKSFVSLTPSVRKCWKHRRFYCSACCQGPFCPCWRYGRHCPHQMGNTHGGKTDENARPRIDMKNCVALVNNGTIENANKLSDEGE